MRACSENSGKWTGAFSLRLLGAAFLAGPLPVHPAAKVAIYADVGTDGEFSPGAFCPTWPDPAEGPGRPANR